MPPIVLNTLKVIFLVLLYLFILRLIRVVWLDLVGPRAPRPKQQTSAKPGAAAKPRQRPKSVVVTEDGSQSRTYPLSEDEALTIGRGETCQIVLKDTYVSQAHTRIFAKEGTWYVEDLGSTNGTYLNRAKVSDASQLAPGDEVRVGKTVIEVRR